ncbi:hypothetical protein [Rhodoferax sp. GW822-FHT02A01]|uniref:hypothetical protein n=1 Tax=Rhodoferax sp. GW822-FHT02A01 TaxID=3141537 RepID=UPI00315D34BE
MRNTFKIGTVFEFRTFNGDFFYGQLTHRHRLMGDLIRFRKIRFIERQPQPELLFQQEAVETQYAPCFSSIKVLTRTHDATMVATCAVPSNLADLPYFRGGVIAPEIGLYQKPSIWDGESFHPLEKYPAINTSLLPELASIPIQDIRELAELFPKFN